MKKKKIVIIVVVIVAVIAGAVGWYCYHESQKGPLEKAGEKTDQFGKDVVKSFKKLGK